MDASERKTYVQILGQVLISDGVLADAERSYLDKVMDSLGMTAAERKQALMGISLDSPIEERVATLSSQARHQLREEMARAGSIDGPPNGALLARLRAALEL